MRARFPALLVHVMWMVAGVVLGGTAALFYVTGLDPNWIEATGTWFGGVATVLTLLWAVQTFRADQANREAEQQRRHDELMELQLKEEAARLAEASLVSVALRGGGGYGNPGMQTMNSIHIDIHNDTAKIVTVTGLSLDEPIVSLDEITTPFRIAPHSTETIHVRIADVDADAHELGGRPFTRFGAHATYLIDGQTWNRTSSSEPLEEVPRLHEL